LILRTLGPIKKRYLDYADLVIIMQANRRGEPIPAELQGLEAEPYLEKVINEVWVKRNRKEYDQTQTSGPETPDDLPGKS
jgi:hypothetical protein